MPIQSRLNHPRPIDNRTPYKAEAPNADWSIRRDPSGKEGDATRLHTASFAFLQHLRPVTHSKSLTDNNLSHLKLFFPHFTTNCHILNYFFLTSKATLECFQTVLLKTLSYQPHQGKDRKSKIWAHRVLTHKNPIWKAQMLTDCWELEINFSYRNHVACLTIWSR